MRMLHIQCISIPRKNAVEMLSHKYERMCKWYGSTSPTTVCDDSRPLGARSSLFGRRPRLPGGSVHASSAWRSYALRWGVVVQQSNETMDESTSRDDSKMDREDTCEDATRLESVPIRKHFTPASRSREYSTLASGPTALRRHTVAHNVRSLSLFLSVADHMHECMNLTSNSSYPQSGHGA
jgi:hypothetical protein